MSKYSQYFKLALVVIVPVALVVSVIILIANRGFLYSDFRDRIEVSVTSDNQEELNSAINQISQSPNKAFFDSSTNTFYFQNTSLSEVENAASQLQTETLKIEVTQVFVNNRYILENYVWFLVVLTLVTLGSVFYIVLREKGKISFKEILKFYLPFLVTLVVSTILFLGLISLVSRFRFITEFEFIPIFFMNTFLALIFFLSVYKLDYKEEFVQLSFSKRLNKTVRTYSLPFLLVTMVSMAAILVVFGIETLPLIVSFLLSFIILYIVAKWVYMVNLLKINPNLFKLPKKKSQQKKTTPITTADSQPKKKKKKNKKKKK